MKNKKIQVINLDVDENERWEKFSARNSAHLAYLAKSGKISKQKTESIKKQYFMAVRLEEEIKNQKIKNFHDLMAAQREDQKSEEQGNVESQDEEEQQVNEMTPVCSIDEGILEFIPICSIEEDIHELTNAFVNNANIN